MIVDAATVIMHNRQRRDGPTGLYRHWYHSGIVIFIISRNVHLVLATLRRLLHDRRRRDFDQCLQWDLMVIFVITPPSL